MPCDLPAKALRDPTALLDDLKGQGVVFLGACRRNGIRSRFVLIWLHYGKDIQILRPKTNAAPAIFDGLAPERASRVFLIRCGRAA